MRVFRQRSLGCERGFTLAYVALLLVVFILMAALAIDIGVAFTARTAAQHAADSAALAGAYTFITQPLLTGAERVQTAFNDGATVAGTYKVLDVPVNITASSSASETCDVATESMICVDEGKRRVSAVVSAPVQTYFGKILSDLLRVRVIAIAEAATNAAGDRCIKPMYISNDAISDLPLGGGTKPSASDYTKRCQDSLNAGKTIFDASGNVTEWAKDYMTKQSGFKSYISNPWKCVGQAGCPIQLWTKDVTQNPSQVGIVDFSEGQGVGGVDTALVKCAMERCLQECASPKPLFQCGDETVGLKTGTSIGDLTPLDTFIGGWSNNQYQDLGNYISSGNEGPTSPAVVTLLVWDCTLPVPNGTQGELTFPGSSAIKGVAQLFVNKVASSNSNTDTTNGFLVGAGACNGGANASGPGAIPVRLVNR